MGHFAMPPQKYRLLLIVLKDLTLKNMLGMKK